MSLENDAKWIWYTEKDEVNVYADFFEMLNFAGGRYTVAVSADSNYALYINGVLALFGQFSDYPDDKTYDEADITEFLAPGENHIKITVYYQGEDSSVYRKGKAGVIYAVYNDSKPVAVSSENTVCSRNPVYKSGPEMEKISGQLGYTFHMDLNAEEEPKLYMRPVVSRSVRTLRPRPVKKLVTAVREEYSAILTGDFMEGHESAAVGERMQGAYLRSSQGFRKNKGNNLPVTVETAAGADGVFAVVDLGRESVGMLELDLETETECELLVGWGEHLEDLRVRSFISGRNFAAEIRLKPGRNRISVPLRRIAGRYLQLNAKTGKMVLYHAGIRQTYYPVDKVRLFHCADSLHNEIERISVRTLLMCMHEHYEDCPWREQALYTMDSRNQMLCGYYAFNEFDFARESLKLIAASLREDKLLELCSPARVSITIPCFSAMFITQTQEYLEFSRDHSTVMELLPVLTEIADGFIGRIRSNGLIECYTESHYWNFYEWQYGLAGSISGSVPDEKITYDAPLAAFVSMALDSLAAIFLELGETERAEYYRNTNETLKNEAGRRFWDEDKGAYASYISKDGKLSHYAELTNSLFIRAGIAAGKHREIVLEKLSGKKLLPVTLSHSIFKYDALMTEPEKYGRTVFEDVADTWGYMLLNQATTFWETINGAQDFSDAGSLCHGWSAIPLYLYHKYALSLPEEMTGIHRPGLCEKKPQEFI